MRFQPHFYIAIKHTTKLVDLFTTTYKLAPRVCSVPF